MTTPYHVKFAPKAIQQIKQLPSKQQKMVIKVIEALAINPRPPGAKKIDGMTGLYREIANELRIIYKIDQQEILFLLVK